MKGTRRIRLESRVRRDQIAEAVLSIAGEEGIQGLSVAAVAHRVGITPSALYRHYPSKEAMLLATLERIGDHWIQNAARARREAHDPLEALRTLLMIHVQMIRDSSGMPFLLFSEGSPRSQEQRRQGLLTVIGRFRNAVVGLVTEAQQAGLVRNDLAPDTLALMFIGLFQPGAIMWHLTRGRFDVTGHARRAWALFEDAIRPPEAGPGDVPPADRSGRAPRHRRTARSERTAGAPARRRPASRLRSKTR